MRRQLAFIILSVFVASSYAYSATVNVYLKDDSSVIGTVTPNSSLGGCNSGPKVYKYRSATLSAVGTLQSPSFNAVDGTNVTCVPQNATDYLIWISGPFTSSGTLSHNVDASFFCVDSTSSGAKMRFSLYWYRASTGGVSSTPFSVSGWSSTACPTSVGAVSINSVTANGTYNVGDRIVIKVEFGDTSYSPAGSRPLQFFYGNATYDSLISFSSATPLGLDNSAPVTRAGIQ